MNDKAYVGIDFGDLELRVVYITDSEEQELPLPFDIKGPHILFDPYSETSPIGVAFPTVQQKLGTNLSFTQMSVKMTSELHTARVEQSTETPASMLTRALSTINHRILDVTGQSAGGLVIAVPSMLTQNARGSLLDCARKAGFTDVNLIDRCTAAALSYHSTIGAKSTTALVYDLGYGTCEYALLRLAGERCRVMSSGAVAEVSGQALDALVIEAIVLELRKEKIYLGLKHFTPFQWQELRELVVRARRTIAEKNEAMITLMPDMTGLDSTIVLQYFKQPFRASITPLLNKAIDAMHMLLDQNALQMANIDTVLLVGSSSGMSPVSDILSEAFAGKAQRTDPLIIASGAAHHAQQRAGDVPEPRNAQTGKLVQPIAESTSVSETVSQSPAKTHDIEGSFVTIVKSEQKPPGPTHSRQAQPLAITSDRRLDLARNLIEQGRRDEARRLLDNVAGEVEELRSRLANDDGQELSRIRIEQAIEMVALGYDFGRAIELTHRAYSDSPDDPEVFEGMLKVHTQAALQMAKPEEYENSIRILNCALSHDQTDQGIRQAIAERQYQHALAICDLKEPAEVFAIVDGALALDAKHAGLNQMHKDLASKMSGGNNNSNSH